jgi:PAS domain-containing protein
MRVVEDGRSPVTVVGGRWARSLRTVRPARIRGIAPRRADTPGVSDPAQIPGAHDGHGSEADEAESGVHAVIAEAAGLLDDANRQLAERADAADDPGPSALDATQERTFRAAAVLGALLLLERAAAAGGPAEPASDFDVDGPWILTSESHKLLYASPAACALLDRTRADLEALVELGYLLRGQPDGDGATPEGPTEVGFAIEMPDGRAREILATSYALPDDAITDRAHVTLLRAAGA